MFPHTSSTHHTPIQTHFFNQGPFVWLSMVSVTICLEVSKPIVFYGSKLKIIRPVALLGYRSIAHEVKLNGLLAHGP